MAHKVLLAGNQVFKHKSVERILHPNKNVCLTLSEVTVEYVQHI